MSVRAPFSAVKSRSSDDNFVLKLPLDVSRLIGWLSRSDDDKSLPLKLLAQGHDADRVKLADAGGIPVLVDLLRGTLVQKQRSVALLAFLASGGLFALLIDR